MKKFFVFKSNFVAEKFSEDFDFCMHLLLLLLLILSLLLDKLFELKLENISVALVDEAGPILFCLSSLILIIELDFFLKKEILFKFLILLMELTLELLTFGDLNLILSFFLAFGSLNVLFRNIILFKLNFNL